MHAYQPRNLDLLSSTCIIDQVALGESSLVYPDIGELTEPSFLELECQADEGCSSSRGKGHRGRRHREIGIVGNDIAFRGVTQVGADTIQKRLHGGVLDCRAHEDRGEFKTDGGAANGVCELIIGGELFVDVGCTGV